MDVYSECGDNSCPTPACKEETVLQQNKLYLAFENTLNVEYITEIMDMLWQYLGARSLWRTGHLKMILQRDHISMSRNFS